MIYFVRHGDKAQGSFYNETLGICDEPLSEKGQGDAERLVAFFRDIHLQRIYASTYIRTQQTAAPVAHDKELPVIADARLNEINGGAFHRMGETAFQAAYPDFWREFSAHTHDMRFPGGESGADVKARQDSFLADIAAETRDILVVSHDGFIRLLMCNILGLPVYMRYKFETNMGGVSAIEYDGGEWHILQFNQTV